MVYSKYLSYGFSCVIICFIVRFSKCFLKGLIELLCPEISNSILEGILLEKGEAKEGVEEIVNQLDDLVIKQIENIKLNG